MTRRPDMPWFRQRKPKEAAMTAQTPDEARAEITMRAGPDHEARMTARLGFLRRTPHPYARDYALNVLYQPCVCGLDDDDEIHDAGGHLDVHAFLGGYGGQAERDARRIAEQPAPLPGPGPGGVLGYLVAIMDHGRVKGTTHTTLLKLDAAQAEAGACGAISPARRFTVVEVREAGGDGR